MKKISRALWGIVLVAVGVILALNAFGFTSIDIFFDGWWTLFIIVPCVIGLCTDYDKSGHIIGICIGVFLLLCCQDILTAEQQKHADADANDMTDLVVVSEQADHAGHDDEQRPPAVKEDVNTGKSKGIQRHNDAHRHKHDSP